MAELPDRLPSLPLGQAKHAIFVPERQRYYDESALPLWATRLFLLCREVQLGRQGLFQL